MLATLLSLKSYLEFLGKRDVRHFHMCGKHCLTFQTVKVVFVA